MSTELTARDRRIFEATRRAKNWIESAVSDTIHFEFTHAQMLQKVHMYLDTSWFKCVPQYRIYEVKGFKEALISSHHSTLHSHLKSALLFESILYSGWDQWRNQFPKANPNDIQNVLVWKSGKVYSAADNLMGVTFAWHMPK